MELIRTSNTARWSRIIKQKVKEKYDYCAIDLETNEIIQENHFYAGGLKLEGQWNNGFGLGNPFTMQGNEEIADFDLNTNVYQFRHLDPATWSWWQPDPMGEEFNDWSPYNLSLGNPVNVIDPDGAYAVTLTGAAAQAAFGKVKSSLMDMENIEDGSNDPNDGVGVSLSKIRSGMQISSGAIYDLAEISINNSGKYYAWNHDLTISYVSKTGSATSMLMAPRYFDIPSIGVSFNAPTKFAKGIRFAGNQLGNAAIAFGAGLLVLDGIKVAQGELRASKFALRSGTFLGSIYAGSKIGARYGKVRGALVGAAVGAVGHGVEQTSNEVRSWNLRSEFNQFLFEAKMKLRKIYRIK